MPRAATFVATSAVTCPVLNWSSVRLRCGCERPPCRAAARTPLASSRLAKRSAARLVSTNMITRPSRAAIFVATAFLSVSSRTWSTWCSIVVTAPADGSTECTTGSVRNIFTSRSMFLSRVAENSIRWPSGSTCLSSATTCGMKPMSAIWSASSRTVMATSSRRQSPRSMRSLSRPGVATRISAPRRRVADCLVIDMPPTTVASRRFTAVAYGVSASVTCWASSRVGTRTMASGARGSARRPAVRASMASPKARVLPEPVRPRPRMSRPASEFGRVAPWIGKGSVTPCAARVFSSAAGMSRSAKASTEGSAGVTVSGRANSPCGGVARRRPAGLEPPWPREPPCGRERGAVPRPFDGACAPWPAWPRPRPRAGRERGVRSWRSELVIRNCPPGGFLGNCRMG